MELVKNTVNCPETQAHMLFPLRIPETIFASLAPFASLSAKTQTKPQTQSIVLSIPPTFFGVPVQNVHAE